MPSPIHHLLQQTSSVGGLGGLLNSAEFIAAFRDLGNGAVDLALDRGTGPATFTRATAASTKLSTGLWKLDVASGTARSFYFGMNTAVGAYGGYLAEGARTNLCLQSRDLSNASWTKVNTTGAKDQTGIDGVANSASSLTATLGGGTCLQTITEAPTDSTLSLFIKRITGTGTITIQQGASTSEISAQVNSTTYTQVSLDATVLNPSIGITLGTNGDKIAVDCVQFENGAFASTPIPTTTVAVTRNADVLTYPTSGNVSGTIGAAYAEFTTSDTLTTSERTILGGTPSGGLVYMNNGAGNPLSTNDGTTEISYGLNINAPVTTPKKACVSWAGTSINAALSGTLGTAQTSDGNLSFGASIAIGIDDVGLVRPLFGTVKNVRLWARQLPDAAIVVLTT